MQKDTIPNKALNGREVMECILKDVRKMMERDCVFLPGVAYRRVAFSATITVQLGYPHQPHTVRVHVDNNGIVEGEPPLKPPPPEGEGIVVGLKVDGDLSNPNLARVSHDLPITVQERELPKPLDFGNALPGDMPPSGALDPFPKMVTKEFRYSKDELPPAPEPVYTDISDAEAARLGSKPRPKMEGKSRVQGTR